MCNASILQTYTPFLYPIDLPKDFDPDLLDSTSSYLPAPSAYDEESTLLSPDMSMLASSLSDAYGLTSLADQSHLLSGVGKEAVMPLEFRRSGVTAMEPSGAWKPVAGHSLSGLPSQRFPAASGRQEVGLVEWAAERPRCGPGGATPSPGGYTTHHITGNGPTHPPADGQELSFGTGTVDEYLTHDYSPMPSTAPVNADPARPTSELLHTATGMELPGTALSIELETESSSSSRQSSAAVMIQAAFRGHLRRQRLGPFVRQSKAATVIQAAWCAHTHSHTCKQFPNKS